MNRFARAAVTAAATSIAALSVSTAYAGETRGFVVSWFYPSAAADDAKIDCPKGTTPDAATNVIRMLKEQNKTPAEIEKRSKKSLSLNAAATLLTKNIALPDIRRSLMMAYRSKYLSADSTRM